MNERQRRRLAESGLPDLQFDAPMNEHATLRAGGKAAALIEASSLDELLGLVRLLDREQIKFLMLGRGSNILVADSGYSGAMIRLKGEFDAMAIQKSDAEAAVVKVGAGCSLARLIAWCSRQGLAGLEFLSGIPGSVGGAVRMNAGAWGEEIGMRLLEIAVVDGCGECRRIPASELRLSYRRLELADGRIEGMAIVSALLRLHLDHEASIRSRCASFLERRRGKQPAGAASAGSFFKNPPGDFAGRLIEAAGMKGACIGAAMVSPMHANFIVNVGGASASDILALAERVQAAVLAQFSIQLEPEVKIIREGAPADSQ